MFKGMTVLYWTTNWCVLQREKPPLLFQAFLSSFLVFFVWLRPPGFDIVMGIILVWLIFGQLLLRLYGVASDITRIHSLTAQSLIL